MRAKVRHILMIGLLAVACSQQGEDATPVTTPTVPPVQAAATAEAEMEAAEAEDLQLQYPESPIIIATPDTSREAIELDVSLIGPEVTTLDPQRVSNINEVELVENLFAGLTRYNRVTGDIEGELAESWSVSPDGRRWTFQLRTDIFWVQPIPEFNIPVLERNEAVNLREVQTVRQVVANDVVYAVQRACDPASSTPDAFVLFIIHGCEEVHQQSEATAADRNKIAIQALGPFTLEIGLTKPASHFLSITSLPIMRPVPRDIIAAAEPGTDWADPALLQATSGPFVLSPRTAVGTRYVLEHNPFWPYRFAGNVDVVNLYQFEDSMAAYEKWAERELDVTRLPGPLQEDMLARSPQKTSLVTDQSVFYLAFDNAGKFSSPELRRAFSAAIDRTVLLEEVYANQGRPMRHFTPPGVIGAPQIDEIGVGYDPSFARQQLVASGVGGCRALGEIRYMVSSADASLFQAELIRDMWVETLGCEEEQIVIEQVPFGTLLASTQPGAEARPDVWDLGWASYYPDGHNWFADVLHCVDGDNRMNRPCSEVDDLIRRAQTAEPELREQIYRRVEYDLFSSTGETPIAPLFVRGNYLVVQTWVDTNPQRFAFATFGGEQFDTYLLDWELKKIEKRQ